MPVRTLVTRELLCQYMDKGLAQALHAQDWALFKTRLGGIKTNGAKLSQVLYFLIVHRAPMDVVQMLLDRKVDLNEWSPMQGLQSYPLREALLIQDMRLFKVLLEHGADPNMRDGPSNTGSSILEYACGFVEFREELRAVNYGCFEVNEEAVRLLVKHGCQLDDEGDSGRNALWLSCTLVQFIPATKLLVELGADVNMRSKGADTTALMTAVTHGNIPATRFLLEHGADVHARFPASAHTMVHLALLYRFEPDAHVVQIQILCELLLRHGLDVNARDDLGKTALDTLGELGDAHPPIVRCLLKYGATVGSAIIHSAIHQRFEVVEILLQAGGDPNSRLGGGVDDDASNYFFAAIRSGNFVRGKGKLRELKLMLWAGMDLDFVDPVSQLTALYAATFNGLYDTVKLLLQAGADRNQALHGFTPLQVAIRRGEPQIAKLLNGDLPCGRFSFDPDMLFTLCASCRKETSELQICVRCDMVAYCNAECQRTHWGAHKKVCNKKRDMAAMRAKLPWNQQASPPDLTSAV